MLDPAFAAGFTAAMDSRGLFLGPAAARALDLGRHRALLDIAGGSGIYACAFVDQHPHLTATVFERPPVDAVAARAVADRGFADRVAVQDGDDAHVVCRHDVGRLGDGRIALEREEESGTHDVAELFHGAPSHSAR